MVCLNAVVSGGAGFIGSHIAELLLENCFEVKVIDNLFEGKLENVPKQAEFVEGDIRDYGLMEKELAGCDFVLHQAARRSVTSSFEEAEQYHKTNVQGTYNLLKASHKNAVKKFVFASSSSVYGNSKDFPLKESLQPAPLSPYAATKVFGEQYCDMFLRLHGLKTISLRYFNVFGPRQSPESKYACVVPLFAKAAFLGKPCTIFGSGKQSRDFTFVRDVADANLKAMLSKATGAHNIAGGMNVSVLELHKKINDFFKCKQKPVFAPARSGEALKTLASLEKAKRFLGWKPKTPFNKGLQKTLEWFRKEFSESI